MSAAVRGIQDADEFAEFLDLAVAGWAGRTPDELSALGRSLFRDDIASKLHREMWQVLAEHRAKGHRIVLASSATRFQVEPMAEEVEADDILCTQLEVADGVLTGRTEGPALWGAQKAKAAAADAIAHDVDLDASFAYADGAEDVDLLDEVGHPTVVSPHPSLREVAAERGWPVLDCEPGGSTLSSITDLARTVGFYGAMVGAFGAGLGVGLLRRSRRHVLDIAGSAGSDVGLALAGIDVRVQGGENLWSSRPCLFLFNHQSKLDVILLMKLLRGGFTGVAKKEAADIPFWGQVFQVADVAFIERGHGDPAKAREALAPAVSKLRDEGLSIAMAPEGTRSPTPRLGRFKKGAFHIAMQAQVPVVPMVFRNAGELQWRGAQLLHPGTVDVCVLPPVDTSGWAVETMNEHVAEVREMFVRTLADWPQGEGTTIA
jgi:putative phosphoserine phosphatase / 1-acylglycerol-3-phosphate O-acyltransferase